MGLFVAAISFNAYSQCSPSSNTINISTGWNPNTGSIIIPPPGGASPDPMWTLAQSPPPPTGYTINIGGPAWVIPENLFWDLPGGTCKYINAFPTGESLLDNWNTSTTIPYIFEREFCICDPGTGNPLSANINFSLNADNWAEVYVSGPSITGSMLLMSQPYIYSVDNFENPPNIYNGTLNNLQAGTYTLELHLRNKESSVGAALNGSISGIGVRPDSDCNPNGIIAGIKYNDCDQSGTISAGDIPVGGVTIQLKSSSGVVLSSTTTDNNGYYFFTGVTPGTYQVAEVVPSGWTVISPTGGIYSSVSVSGASVTQLNFLNYNLALCPVDPGSIFGHKYNDCDQSGDVSNGDQIVAGITIEVKDGGTVIGTGTTNSSGYYSISGIPPGTYTVSEVLPAGWTAVSPAGGIHSSITIVSNLGQAVNFLNYKADECKGSISGTKYNDCDQSGDISPGDIPVGGVTIELLDAGVVIGGAVTDINGDYSIIGITPGTYNLQEILGPGWSAVSPAGGLYSSVTVLSSQNIVRDFLNYKADECPSTPCTFELAIDASVENCKVDFSPIIIPAPQGASITYDWTFGDGYSSTLSNPVHFYQAPGTYIVCLTVTVVANGQTCVKTVCIDITVTDPCEGGCDIDATIVASLDDETCTFDFSVVVNNTGVPITDIYWDFGDGNSGVGSSTSHQYSSQGAYMVCVTLFGLSEDGECCFETFCIEVESPCETSQPGGGGVTGKPGGVFDPSQRLATGQTGGNQDAAAAEGEGCEGRVTISYTIEGCTVLFSSSISGIPAGWQVVGTTWTFGNGYSSSSANPSHAYTGGPQTYTVCLDVLLFDGKECCRIKVCETVNIEEPCPPGQGGFSERIATEGASATMNLYPNPSDGDFTLSLEAKEAATAVLEIMDLKGSVVYRENLGASTEGLNTFRVGADLPAGMYIVNLKVGHQQLHHRLVIQ